MWRMIFPATAVTLVGLLGWWIDAASRTPVTRERFVAAPPCIFAAGRVEGSCAETELRSWEAGRVTEILVAASDCVSAGQVLLRLDDERERHDLALATAELARAEAEMQRLVNGARQEERLEAAGTYQAKVAQLERARLTWTRTQSLRADRVVSDQQVDDHRTQVVQLQAEVAAAKARWDLLTLPARNDELLIARSHVAAAQATVELARMRLARRQLCAPYAGCVLQVDIELGELTGPAASAPPVRMADTSRMRVRAFVEELEAPRIQTGMLAEIAAEGLARRFRGTITEVSPRMTSKSLWTDDPDERFDTKYREIWIELHDHQDLVLGLPVDVFIQTAGASSGL